MDLELGYTMWIFGFLVYSVIFKDHVFQLGEEYITVKTLLRRSSLMILGEGRSIKCLELPCHSLFRMACELVLVEDEVKFCGATQLKIWPGSSLLQLAGFDTAIMCSVAQYQWAGWYIPN